jgi:predicted transcriptional regulator
MTMFDAGSDQERILAYLGEKYRQNQQAEVSGQELSHELDMDMLTVRQTLEYLACEGLVDGELALVNVWVRLSEEGSRLRG